MYNHYDIPVGVIISPTEQSNGYYQEFIPKMFIHPRFQPEIVKRFIERQKLNIKKSKMDSNIDPRAYIILDDCMFDDSWKRDPYIQEIFFNGRWLKCLFIFCLQDPMGCGPSLRNNVDYTFILSDTKITNRKKIYEHYASVFPSFQYFCDVMDACTQNYECLVINNKATSGKLEDQVFWYKADMHDKFHVGPDEIWTFSEENYRDDDDADEINISTYKKKAPPIKVKKI
jgi:hypothetical protein